MAGGFLRKTLLVELQAGHDEHVILAPGPLALPLQHIVILIELFPGHCEVEQFAEFADEAPRICDMVGDANAIEAAPAVEVDHFGQSKAAVRIIRVNVKVAKLHLRSARKARAARFLAFCLATKERYWAVWNIRAIGFLK